MGDKSTYFGNATALSARNIEKMHESMYGTPAVGGGTDLNTPGLPLTGNLPIEVQNGARLDFTFKDRDGDTIPKIVEISEVVYLNGRITHQINP